MTDGRRIRQETYDVCDEIQDLLGLDPGRVGFAVGHDGAEIHLDLQQAQDLVELAKAGREARMAERKAKT